MLTLQTTISGRLPENKPGWEVLLMSKRSIQGR